MFILRKIHLGFKNYMEVQEEAMKVQGEFVKKKPFQNPNSHCHLRKTQLLSGTPYFLSTLQFVEISILPFVI